MDFTDYVLVRLADPATRASLFDQQSLEALVTATFGEAYADLTGPYDAIFDELSLGVALPRRGLVDGFCAPLGSPTRTEVRFNVAGLAPSATVRADALWRGSLIARVVPATAPINSVKAGWPTLAGIDAEIVAALGSLPTDPVQLEAERRKRFLARIRAAMMQPDAFEDAMFDAWLRQVGATSVGDLMTRFQGQILTGALQVAFAAAPQGDPVPKTLPVAAAILVRDAGFSVAGLLADSKLARDCLADVAGLERSVPADAAGMNPRILVVWIVPDTTFDDPDWPGGDAGTNDTDRRNLRRAAAASWLAKESIGVLTAPKHP